MATITNNVEYLELISREPTAEMVTDVKDKEGNIQYKYIKKSLLQKELLDIYGGHTKWEQLRETVTTKGLYGVGRLEYRHPISGEWLSVTGTASLPHDKKMRLGFPALEGNCFLNAVKKIGVWFGQTLNNTIEDIMPDETLDDGDSLTEEEKAASLTESLAFCKTVEELKTWRMPVYAKGTSHEIKELYEQRLRELSKK